MKKVLLTLVLISNAAMAQVPVQVCEDKPLNMPRGIIMNPNGGYTNIPWNGPNSQIIRTCRIVMVPSQNVEQVTPQQQQQLQQLVR